VHKFKFCVSPLVIRYPDRSLHSLCSCTIQWRTKYITLHKCMC